MLCGLILNLQVKFWFFCKNRDIILKKIPENKKIDVNECVTIDN